jgi:hypothetical protein
VATVKLPFVQELQVIRAKVKKAIYFIKNNNLAPQYSYKILFRLKNNFTIALFLPPIVTFASLAFYQSRAKVVPTLWA